MSIPNILQELKFFGCNQFGFESCGYFNKHYFMKVLVNTIMLRSQIFDGYELDILPSNIFQQWYDNIAIVNRVLSVHYNCKMSALVNCVYRPQVVSLQILVLSCLLLCNYYYSGSYLLLHMILNARVVCSQQYYMYISSVIVMILMSY